MDDVGDEVPGSKSRVGKRKNYSSFLVLALVFFFSTLPDRDRSPARRTRRRSTAAESGDHQCRALSICRVPSAFSLCRIFLTPARIYLPTSVYQTSDRHGEKQRASGSLQKAPRVGIPQSTSSLSTMTTDPSQPSWRVVVRVLQSTVLVVPSKVQYNSSSNHTVGCG